MLLVKMGKAQVIGTRAQKAFAKRQEVARSVLAARL